VPWSAKEYGCEYNQSATLNATSMRMQISHRAVLDNYTVAAWSGAGCGRVGNGQGSNGCGQNDLFPLRNEPTSNALTLSRLVPVA
jgi:hypothetical protein